LHQVVLLHAEFRAVGEVDRARVVDDDVDPTELLDRRAHSRVDGCVVANVSHDGQGLSAGILDRLGGRAEGARKPRMRPGSLGEQGDVRTVAARM